MERVSLQPQFADHLPTRRIRGAGRMVAPVQALFFLRLGAQTFATLLGSLAVFAVWMSFYAPESAWLVLLYSTPVSHFA
jgi:hypothetical protein